MSLFDYTVAIKIKFDKTIENDPAIVTGSESYRIPQEVLNPTGSSEYSIYYKKNAFDGLASSYWRPSTTGFPQWIGQDFGQTVTVSSIRLYLVINYCPNVYIVQGSSDGSVWTDIVSGNLTNATGWQTIAFSPQNYRYWRLYFTSKYGTYLYVHEVEFWGTRNTYNTAGWSVTTQEYDREPGGHIIDKAHAIRKITRSDDHFSLIVWLDLKDRLRSPTGVVTVTYSRDIGNLIGPLDVKVADFSLQLVPTNIAFAVSPNCVERIDATAAVSSTRLALSQWLTNNGRENIDLGISATCSLIHISQLQQ